MARSADEHLKQIEDLERELQRKSLLLANLEVMIEDYRREKSRLLAEFMSLREKLVDLTGREGEPNEDLRAGHG
jgi:predicted  nucleic acid-binding Zn-ribbon protein